MDESAFPWQADWYRRKVEQHAGGNGDGRFIKMAKAMGVENLFYVVPLFREQRVHGRGDDNVWADHYIVTNVDGADVQAGKIEVCPAELPKICIAAVIKVNRGLQPGYFLGVRKQFF